MERSSNKVPVSFPPVSDFYAYPPQVRMEILSGFSLSNMIEYLTRVLHPSNRYSARITHGLQPPEEAINNLVLTANEAMLNEFLNSNINFNLMCYLTAQNKRSRGPNNNPNTSANLGNHHPVRRTNQEQSPFDDFTLVIPISPEKGHSSSDDSHGPVETPRMDMFHSNDIAGEPLALDMYGNSRRAHYSPYDDYALVHDFTSTPPPTPTGSQELIESSRIPDRDDYLELLKIWYSYPRVSEMSPNWFFDVWNKNFFFSREP